MDRKNNILKEVRKTKSALIISTRKYADRLVNILKSCDFDKLRLVKGKHISLDALLQRLEDYKTVEAYVLGFDALEEKDERLLAKLRELREIIGNNKPIIIYAPNLFPDSAIVRQLHQNYKVVVRWAGDERTQAKNEQSFFESVLHGKIDGYAPLYTPLSLVSREDTVSSLTGRYDSCFGALQFIGIGKRVGKTYAALATALFFRMCRARVLFLFSDNSDYEHFKRFYCPTAEKETEMFGYQGIWYRENTNPEELLFISSVGRKVRNEQTLRLQKTLNFVIVDEKRDLRLEMTETVVLVTSCGFSDDSKAREVLAKLSQNEVGGAVHAISLGDDRRQAEFAEAFPYFRHFTVPFLPEITEMSRYFPTKVLQGFMAAFPPETWRFFEQAADVAPLTEIDEKKIIFV